MELANQPHPPRKKNRKKADLNVRKSVYYKDGDSTMLFCKDVTIPMAKLIVQNVKLALKRLDVNMKGNLIVTQ